MPFLLPMTLQLGLGMNPFHSGTITCASAFGAIFMKAICSRVLQRFGFRRVLIWNAVAAALILSSYGLFSISTPYLVMLLCVLLGGSFPSMQFTCLNTLAYADLDSADASRATSLASVVQQISLGMGVTISALVVNISNRAQGHPTIVAADFWPAFVVVGLLSIASIPMFRELAPNAGAAVSGRKAA
jgi:MFS family permease